MSYEFPCKGCEKRPACNQIQDHCDKFKACFFSPAQFKMIHELPTTKICPYCGALVEKMQKNEIDFYHCTECQFQMPYNMDLKNKLGALFK